MSNLLVGLTGGIGCGKSTVAALMQQRGVLLVDTDAISRSLTGAGGLAIPLLRKLFDSAYFDEQGALDRARMRALIFADPEAKIALEAVLHPLINEEAHVQAARSQASLKVFDIPLLIEGGRWRPYLQRVVVVDCDPATQVLRVAQRPGWSQALAQQVIAQQASRSTRLACADVVITNQDVDLSGLATLVDVAVEQLQHWGCGTMPCIKP